MIKVLLLDLGDTLERDNTVLPGVPEALSALQGFRTVDDAPLTMCLASDYTMPQPRTPEAVEAAFREYVDILDQLNLRQLFEPVERRVTLSTQAGVLKPARAFFEFALQRAGATAVSFAECLFITESGPHIEACRAMGMATLQFGVDFKRWLDAPPMVARLVNPTPGNLQAALAPTLAAAHGVRLEAVREVAGQRLRGSGRQWVPLEAPDLGPLQGVHIEMPVAIEARTGPDGRVESVQVARPAASDVAEAADYVRSLHSSEQIAGISPAPDRQRVVPTHTVETDAEGRRLLVRRRFTAV